MSDEKQKIDNEKRSRHQRAVESLISNLIFARQINLPGVAGAIDLRFVDFIAMYENMLEIDGDQPVTAEIKPLLTIETEPHLALIMILRVMAGDVLYKTSIEIRREPIIDIFQLFRIRLEGAAKDEPMEFA